VLPGRNVIARDGEQKHLENRVMQTLVFLAEHQGQPLTREQFFDAVWRGRVVNEEALSRAISLLRTALEDDARAPKYIQTIPGVGYRLIADVGRARRAGEPTPPTRATPTNSVAVLPFVNMSGDPANEYFSDGISEEILNVLSQGERFKVAGRTSSFAFKGRNEDLREIGRTLDVAHVLEGSVRRADHRVRITAQLIKASDGYHLWSETFDRELDDVFAIQDEIASAVAHALEHRMLSGPDVPHTSGGTRNTQAYQAYLLGLHFRNRGALRDPVERAIDAFNRAIALDPEYARAWSHLAFSWIDMLWNGYVDAKTARGHIYHAGSRAIELAPDHAGGHLALGLYWQMGIPNWQAAQEAIDTGLALNSGNTHLLLEAARVKCNLGKREESIELARKVREQDPIHIYANHVLGTILYFARRYGECIPAFRRTLDMDPHYPKPHYFIAMSLYWLGETQAAWEEVQHEPLEWMYLTASAATLFRLGRTEEAREMFQRMLDAGASGNMFIQIADIHAQLGDADRAIDALHRALDLRDPGLTQLLVDPFLDPIRDDPRFQRIFAQAGFAEV